MHYYTVEYSFLILDILSDSNNTTQDDHQFRIIPADVNTELKYSTFTIKVRVMT